MRLIITPLKLGFIWLLLIPVVFLLMAAAVLVPFVAIVWVCHQVHPVLGMVSGPILAMIARYLFSRGEKDSSDSDAVEVVGATYGLEEETGSPSLMPHDHPDTPARPTLPVPQKELP